MIDTDPNHCTEKLSDQKDSTGPYQPPSVLRPFLPGQKPKKSGQSNNRIQKIKVPPAVIKHWFYENHISQRNGCGQNQRQLGILNPTPSLTAHRQPYHMAKAAHRAKGRKNQIGYRYGDQHPDKYIGTPQIIACNGAPLIHAGTRHRRIIWKSIYRFLYILKRIRPDSRRHNKIKEKAQTSDPQADQKPSFQLPLCQLANKHHKKKGRNHHCQHNSGVCPQCAEKCKADHIPLLHIPQHSASEIDSHRTKRKRHQILYIIERIRQRSGV